uniref:chaperone protein dnaJ A6, chloroplastic-like n=1 Tax=Styela clava TaxID=7725 RepID=UPI00193A1C60|nr:chaperone protein dnaJ A6, chloroplastic-like [Styela clava]
MSRICLKMCGCNYVTNSLAELSINIHARRMKSYYDLLGIKIGASQEEIKAAFYEKSKKLHPDTSFSTGSDKDFMEIKDAYETLKNTDSRQRYNQFIHSDDKGAQIHSNVTYQHHRDGFDDFISRQHFKDGYDKKYKYENEEKFDPISLIYLGLFCALVGGIIYAEKTRRKNQVTKQVKRYLPEQKQVGNHQQIHWVEQPAKRIPKQKTIKNVSDPPPNPISDLRTWK